MKSRIDESRPSVAGMRRASRAAALGLLLALAGIAPGCDHEGASSAEESGIYYCAMHPTYTSKQPGNCPICSMKLVKRQPAGVPSSSAAAALPAVAGRVPVTIPAERQQLIGVTTDVVKRVPLQRTVRTVGRVAYDEARLQHVHVKFSGYVEHPYVDFTGAVVKEGDKLFEIYSPELHSTEQEYLIAKRSYDQVRGKNLGDAERRALELLQASRERLLLWDLSAADIAALERAGAPGRSVTIRSPYSGVVVERQAVHGMQVNPGDTVFAIADASEMWVLADVYEYELPFVAVGQHARMTLSYLPGRSWEGTVTFIYPTVEAKTRTVKVRIEFANPELALKPDMFADVVMQGDLGEALVVPERAVISTGLRDLVFVDRGAGRLEPRVVDVGAHLSDAYEVRAGLAEGERVVTSGNFLIDSESRLEASVSGAASAAAARDSQRTSDVIAPSSPTPPPTAHHHGAGS